MNALITVFLVILAFALYGVITSTPESREARRQANEIAAQEREEGIERHRAAISREMELDDDEKAMLTNAIQRAGFNCPAAKLFFSRGENAEGVAMMVWCGPNDREGVNENTRFLVTILPDNSLNVRPYAG